MKYRLEDLCFYAKGKIEVDVLTEKNYISTENMLPNKGGITTATSLPSTAQTKKYQKFDTLVSNIRPYFKKIWFAEFDGGCSNDVLVFRARDGVCKRFLYYVLANDTFFDYSMATSKGTKMPRGDKTAIMKYDVPDFTYEEQEKIAEILDALDRKIQLNAEINKNLYEQIQLLCTAWFTDYEPFGGTMPSDWIITPLSEIATFESGYSYKSSELQSSRIAMATIKNFDRHGGFKLDGFKELIPSPKLKSTQHVELFDTLVAHTDLTQGAEVIGNAELVLSKSGYEDIIFSMDVVKVLPKDNRVSKFMIAALLHDSKFKGHCLGYVNGTTVLHLSKKALPDYVLSLPADMTVLKPLDDALSVIYMTISNNIEENLRLRAIRDSILPKLMNGEIEVSDINL